MYRFVFSLQKQKGSNPKSRQCVLQLLALTDGMFSYFSRPTDRMGYEKHCSRGQYHKGDKIYMGYTEAGRGFKVESCGYYANM